MLRELHISNLAVISDARLELAPGLNCFTGATGAGKSLIIGAVEVLLGLRSPAEMLRTGADEGRVSGVFEVRNAQTLAAIGAATDVNVGEAGGELLLTRRLYASGRSSASLNGQPITLAMLRAAAEHLVDVHGQHDHQYLLRPSNQLDVLDQYGELWPLRRQYAAVFEQLQSARRRIEELSTSASLRRQQLELYRFQADEIDAAELDPAEYAELQSRSTVLSHLEKLKKEGAAIHGSLYEVDGSVLERLKMMVAILAELAMLDGNLNPIAGNLRDATISIEECALDLSRYLQRLDLDPAELGEVNDRLNTIHRLLNKYEGTVEGTLAYRAEIGKKIDSLEHASEDVAALQRQIDPLQREMRQLGEQLSSRRAAVAKKLAPKIESQLAELGMEKAKFTIALASAGAADDSGNSPVGGASGLNTIEFIVQTNPGQAPQPLRKIASGGELSRIMLALKGILAAGDRVSVLVFDEIDSNVGGRLGAVIGRKLLSLAEHHQVLCITHLPQIAAYADRHFAVRKQIKGKQTESQVEVIAGEKRIAELAEMIGGASITKTTRAQAMELLEMATSWTAGA